MPRNGTRIPRICQHCGTAFQALAIHTRRGGGLYCSPTCAYAHRTRPEVFWSQLDTAGDCWLFTGNLNSLGYGTLGYGGRRYLAHRLAWELTHGAIPAGLLVCHRCDTPACCRPDHMFLGTNADNIHDAMSKGRLKGHYRGPGYPGERNGQAKLTEGKVREIRRLAATGWTYARLGQEFGVSLSQARNVVLRRCWQHID